MKPDAPVTSTTLKGSPLSVARRFRKPGVELALERRPRPVVLGEAEYLVGPLDVEQWIVVANAGCRAGLVRVRREVPHLDIVSERQVAVCATLGDVELSVVVCAQL